MSARGAASWLVALALAGASLARASEPLATRPKLIHHGWGNPDTESVAATWRQMVELPFDGTAIHVAVDRAAWHRGERSTPNRLGWVATGPRAFRVDEFADAIRELCSVDRGVLGESFLDVALASSASDPQPGWFDEARWETITANFGVIAEIAARCGLRGLIVDPEHYDRDLFRWRHRWGRSFAETAAAARRRGRQAMAAIAANLPRPVLLFLFGYTLPLRNLDEARSLESAEYGLLVSFLDGFLEAVPAEGRIIDGYELGYALETKAEFRRARQAIRKDARRLAADGRSYDSRLEVGFGLWLDPERRLERFSPAAWQRVVANALATTERYVWVHSQTVSFYPPSEKAVPYLEAMRAARATVPAR